MSQRIFVGNLPHSTTEAELTELFAQHGAVSSASVVKDKFTQRSRGFAFVEMASDDEARAAIDALNGHELEGRTLTVNVARPRGEGGDRGGPRGSRAGQSRGERSSRGPRRRYDDRKPW
ncbi:MAG: RNA-binding protein [candidate division WOR-3 bacterium]|nr:MAG: RNA-binding protein [candidate division WOR-3 bacterium]